MKVLVTGSAGRVGSAAVSALLAAGHEVTGVDSARPSFDRQPEGSGDYLQVDLRRAGDAFAVVRGHEAVVHAAAIPSPTAHPAAQVFENNLVSLFNVVEAAVRWDVPRFVNISSETVTGWAFAERPFLPSFAPVDETHPLLPQDPYALAKLFGEQMMDAAVRRSNMRCISLRPSWVQTVDTYERNLGVFVRDESAPTGNLWSYVDVDDLADAIVLAAESGIRGHEVLYVAAADNIGGRDFAAMLRRYYGDRIKLRHVSRPDASGISCAKAEHLLGYRPSRSWRDYLDEEGRAIAPRSELRSK